MNAEEYKRAGQICTALKGLTGGELVDSINWKIATKLGSRQVLIRVHF